MMLTVEFWHLLLLLLSLLGAFAGALWAAAKIFMTQMQRHLDQRFDGFDVRFKGIEQAHKEEATQWQRVERELLDLKAELPVSYVRREDYIRGQSILEAKMDGLAMKLENAQLRGFINKGDSHGAR